MLIPAALKLLETISGLEFSGSSESQPSILPLMALPNLTLNQLVLIYWLVTDIVLVMHTSSEIYHKSILLLVCLH